MVNGVRSCGAGCIDLNKYPFMKSDLCLCNSPLLQQLAAQAANTRAHLLRAIVGAHPAPVSFLIDLQHATNVCSCSKCEAYANAPLWHSLLMHELGRHLWVGGVVWVLGLNSVNADTPVC